jgi:hypothetical protein
MFAGLGARVMIDIRDRELEARVRGLRIVSE